MSVVVTIELISPEAVLKNIIIKITDAYVDEGYTIRDKICPSIILVTARGYFAIQPDALENTLTYIKAKIAAGKAFRIHYSHFDVARLSNKEAFLVLSRAEIPPLPNNLLECNVHFLARTHRTPGRPPEVTRFQYFTFLKKKKT